MHGKKKYNLKRLLDKQPNRIKKSKDFVTLKLYLKASRSLSHLKFNRHVYSLLNQARIEPGDLKRFFLTHKLAQNPFFPLFLKLKKDYQFQLEKKKKEKQLFIYQQMKKIAPTTRKYLKILREYEKTILARYPVWGQYFYPRTKKRTKELLKYSRIEWSILFYSYLETLKSRAPAIDDLYLKKLISLFIFEMTPCRYKSSEIKQQYRQLSKKYHPDTGGTDIYFDLLQKAKNILLQ